MYVSKYQLHSKLWKNLFLWLMKCNKSNKCWNNHQCNERLNFSGQQSLSMTFQTFPYLRSFSMIFKTWKIFTFNSMTFQTFPGSCACHHAVLRPILRTVRSSTVWVHVCCRHAGGLLQWPGSPITTYFVWPDDVSNQSYSRLSRRTPSRELCGRGTGCDKRRLVL